MSDDKSEPWLRTRLMDLQKGFSETLCCPTTAPTTSLFPIYSRFNVHQRSLTPSSFPFPGDLILTVPIRMPWAGLVEIFGALLSVPGNSYVMRSGGPECHSAFPGSRGS